MSTVTAPTPTGMSQIQGNILRPFGGEREAFLFISFNHDRRAARTWLADLAGRINGTADVAATRTGDGGRIGSGRALHNVGLTAAGLILLRPRTAAELAGYDAFTRTPLGARLDDSGRLTTAPALLGDVGGSDPEHWVIGGPATPVVDALLTVAADDDQALNAAIADELTKASDAKVSVIRVDGQDAARGGVLRNDRNHRVEHFGFADGISQPGIRGFGDPVKAGSPVIAMGEFVLGHPGERRPQTWTPRPATPSWMTDGSFQVFRRLRQDVTGWWDRMAALAREDGVSREEAAARALGRHLDGRPLATEAQPGELNAFDYQDDEQGARTALYAHIRKMNPRQDKIFRDRGHKLLRRGIPFGPKFTDGTRAEERGILFNAYMASIEDQFEFIQRRWANDPRFPASTLAKYRPGNGEENRIDGLDPVLGIDADTARRRFGEKVVSDIPPPAFGGLVTTTGAVYAFAPSRPALDWLAGR